MGFLRRILIWVILIPAVLLTLLLAGPGILGLQVYTVRSDDMPDYRSGSLVYVRQADPGTLDTGDVITYMISQKDVQTHRIVGVVTEEGNPSEIRFRTKGDAGTAEDPTLVYYRNVLGVPVLTIPLVGYAADFLAAPAGLFCAAAAGVVWLLLVLLPLFFRGKKSKKGGKYLK